MTRGMQHTQQPQRGPTGEALELLHRRYQTLAAEHERLKGILESFTESFLAMDRDWRIIHLSHRALSKMGLTSEEAIGRNLWELTPEAIESDFYPNYHRVMEERIPLHFETYYPPRSAWYDVHAYPTEQGLAAYVSDITARKLAESKLVAEEAERVAGEILNQMPDAIVLADEQGIILSWMGGAEAIFGFTAAEAIGGAWNFTHSPDARHEAGQQSGEFACLRKDGAEIFVDTQAKLVHSGGRRFWLGIHRDTSERKKIEERLRKSEAQLSDAQDIGQIGSWELDLLSGNMTWSDQLYRDFGLAPAAVNATYSSFLTFVHPFDKARFADVVAEAIKTSGAFQEDHRIVRANGETRDIQARGRVLCNAKGEPARLTGTAQDITDRKRIEAEIRVLNTELELRVAERTADLERSVDDLGQFAYISSHDLQEPLRTITSYTQLLEARYKDHLDSTAREFIGFIVEASCRMSDLIADLLAYSRITNLSSLPLRRVDLAKVFRDVVANLSDAIAETRASVSHGDLSFVLGEETQLTQMLQNLIANAIKYRSSEPPQIQLCQQEEDAWLHFTVEDNGIGIEPAYFDRIFGLFKRLHGRDVPGTGLGLAICKKVVEKHGGRIWVTSGPAPGSIFHFTLRRG